MKKFLMAALLLIFFIPSIASAEEVTIAIAKQINEPQEIIGADFVMPVGKHSGDALKDIDKQYLQWFLDNGNNENIKANIRKYFDDLEIVEVEV